MRCVYKQNKNLYRRKKNTNSSTGYSCHCKLNSAHTRLYYENSLFFLGYLKYFRRHNSQEATVLCSLDGNG